MSKPKDVAYVAGLAEGHGYWNSGTEGKGWHYPKESPYPRGSDLDEEWWRGFDHAVADAEAIYETYE